MLPQVRREVEHIQGEGYTVGVYLSSLLQEREGQAMRNKESEVSKRIARRREKRRRRARMVMTAKILLLWVFCFAAVTGFVIAMETVCMDKPALKWILILSMTYTLVQQIDELVEEIKKSPRNGHSVTGTKIIFPFKGSRKRGVCQ